MTRNLLLVNQKCGMAAVSIVALFCLIVAITTRFATPNSVHSIHDPQLNANSIHDPQLNAIVSLVANTSEFVPDCPFESSCACMRFSEELVRSRKSSILFLHIHKGAGTTMCAMAKANKVRYPIRKSGSNS